MGYTGILCTEAEIDLYVGENVDATGDTEANHNLAVAHAEASACIIGKYDFVTNFATINAVAKPILAEYCARSAAVSLIAYNMVGYTTRIEAEDMINVNVWRMIEIEKLLINPDFVKKIIGGF